MIIDYEFNKNFLICQKNFNQGKLNLKIQILLNRISSFTCISISLLNNSVNYKVFSRSVFSKEKNRKNLHLSKNTISK